MRGGAGKKKGGEGRGREEERGKRRRETDSGEMVLLTICLKDLCSFKFIVIPPLVPFQGKTAYKCLSSNPG